MTTSRASREDLEAAHERVCRSCGSYPDREPPSHEELPIVCGALDAQEEAEKRMFALARVVAALQDKADTLEAELAALRRVEAENLHMEREQHVLHDEHRWCIGDASNGVVGWGLTMVEALAIYDDARKEQGHG